MPPKGNGPQRHTRARPTSQVATTATDTSNLIVTDPADIILSYGDTIDLLERVGLARERAAYERGQADGYAAGLLDGFADGWMAGLRAGAERVRWTA